MGGGGSTRWRSWLRHCATSWKLAVLISDGTNGIFHGHSLSGRTMALGLTQTLIEISTRIFLGGKGDRCVGLATLPYTCDDCLEIGEPHSAGTLSACPGTPRLYSLQIMASRSKS